MSATPPKFFDTLVLMILENHGWSQVQDCQFVKYFQSHGIVFTNWHGVMHPSGPNYRAMLSGNIWSTNEFDGVQRPNLAKHVNFKVLAFKGAPADRHNPFLDMNPSDQRAKPIPNAVLNDSALTDIVYLGLDDQNNAHNGPLAVTDANAIQALQAFGTLKSGHRRLFILLFDEAFGSEYQVNHVFAGAVGSNIQPKQIHSELTHYALAQFLTDNWSVVIEEADPQSKLFAGRSILDIL